MPSQCMSDSGSEIPSPEPTLEGGGDELGEKQDAKKSFNILALLKAEVTQAEPLDKVAGLMVDEDNLR